MRRSLRKGQAALLHPFVVAGLAKKTVYSDQVETDQRSTSTVKVSVGGELPHFVIVVSDNVYVTHRQKLQEQVDKGKFSISTSSRPLLCILNHTSTLTKDFKVKFEHSKPGLGFELNILYKLLEAKGIYVAGHEYENVYQMSRLEEALFLLKDGGAYTITLDSKLYEEVSNKTGVKLKLSVPVATAVGSTNASVSADSVISSSNRVNNEFVTKFCDKPEYERTYNSEGKWFYKNGLQVEPIQLAIKAIEQGKEPPTNELTIHFVRESNSTSTTDLAASIDTILSDTSFLQVLGYGKSSKKESKTEFSYSFKVVFFSKDVMEAVKGVKPPVASAIESLRLSASQLAHLRAEFYNGREKFRDDIIVHLAQGKVLIEELTSDAIVEDAFGKDDALITKYVDLFAGVGGSVKEWLEAQGLGDYYDKFVEHGFDDMMGLSEMKEEHLAEIGITKSGHKRKIIDALAALKEAKDQRRSGSTAKAAAHHELAQAAFYMRQAKEPTLALFMPFTLYGPEGDHRSLTIFTWMQAILSTPGKSLDPTSTEYATLVWDAVKVPKGHHFCSGLKFQPAPKSGRNTHNVQHITAAEYDGIENKHHANIIMNNSDAAVDPFTNVHGAVLPFGLLVLVIDYSKVAFAQDEDAPGNKSRKLNIAALDELVTPLLGETFENIKSNPPTGKTMKDKVELKQAKRGTLNRYPPLAALLVDNNMDMSVEVDEIKEINAKYKVVADWFKVRFDLTNVFVMPRLSTAGDKEKFNSNASYRTTYITDWNRRAIESLSALRSIIDAAAHHEQQAVAKLQDATLTM